MKKYINYVLFLIIGFVVVFLFLFLLLVKDNKFKVYDEDNNVYELFEKSSKTTKLNLKKDEVLNLAKVYYKIIYNEDYEVKEFGIKYNDVWKCWNVYLENDFNKFLDENPDANYDGKFGIYISDKNGGLLADFGKLYK